MGKRSWLTFLMVIAILGITGFQLYWLRQNYVRERTSLDIRTKITFQETIQDLQVKKLRLGEEPDTGNSKNVQLIRKNGSGPIKVSHMVKNNAVSRINVIREKLRDSLSPSGKPRRMIIENTTIDLSNDTGKFMGRVQPLPGADHIIRLLYGVDSLQDSLRLGEIDTAYSLAIKKQGIDVPYTISKLDNTPEDNADLDHVTIGFVHPVTYRLALGNTLSFLMKKISLPVLFSIILLGITILSFIMLYRSLVKQQRLGDLKNEFISNITHELKTPLATVGVAIEALKNFNATGDREKTKEYLEISTNELQRLGLLVDKVLTLSLFEQKGIEVKPGTINLGELVQEVIASLKLQFEKHGAVVTVQSAGDMNIAGDRTHLLSVILNLLDNALKYSKDKPVIRVAMSGNENEVFLSVQDEGIGIPSTYQEKVFEKFFRVPHGDTHNVKGHGLGLSYVKQVIQKHQGLIDIKSEPASGTTFTITLPRNSI